MTRTRHIVLLLTLATFVALPSFGCGSEGSEADASGPPPNPEFDARERDVFDIDVPGVSYDDHGDPLGLHRYIRWSERIGQGAQPAGEIAFKHLKALGYTTILTVDGAMPQVELAKKYGLSYIHVPIGYEGIPTEAAQKIVKASLSSKGPIYIHCHHGKHRGPCAAMISRMAVDGISSAQGILGLKRSGTNPNYEGLWKTVRTFEVPTSATLAKIGELPSVVRPQGIRAGMVDVNTRWEFIKLSKAEGYKQPKDHPDVSPAHEARMLWELFREMGRTDTESMSRGKAYLALLKKSEDETVELEKAIRAGDKPRADKHYKAVKQLCVQCHHEHRDLRAVK